MNAHYLKCRSRAYLSGDEKAIRYFFHCFGVVADNNRQIFWASIYTAVLYLETTLGPDDTTKLEDNDLAQLLESRQEYCWWMLIEKAKVWFQCHPHIEPDPMFHRFSFRGVMYVVPKAYWITRECTT